MKKIYYVIIFIGLAVIALWVLYFSGWDQLVINLIIINIIIYILRKPLISLFSFFVKNRFYRAIFSITINVIWGVFLLWLVSTEYFEFFIALVPFLIVSASLNFKNIMNNFICGALLLTSEQFEIGDLIETNGIQGLVKEINLNYTQIREFDGGIVVIPNSNVHGSTIIRFTHDKFKIFEPLKEDEFRKKKYYKEYIKMINKILSSKIKTTTYVKKLEILGSVDPESLDGFLSKVFDIYQPIFGIRPDYSVDTTRFGRIRIMLYIKSEKPIIVLNYIDAFLRDILFELYKEDIYEGWDEYKKTLHELKSKNKEVEK